MIQEIKTGITHKDTETNVLNAYIIWISSSAIQNVGSLSGWLFGLCILLWAANNIQIITKYETLHSVEF